MSENICYYNSIIGKLGIVEENGSISSVFYAKDISENTKPYTVLLKNAVKQLSEYFDGSRKKFDLPITMHGTQFQIKVWNALIKIPYGETRSYSEIAEYIGNKNACRAVGGANNKNPLLIIVPCHRVIGKNNSLTGFGCGIDIKERLLQLEKNIF